MNFKPWIYILLTGYITMSLPGADVQHRPESDIERIQYAIQQELKHHPKARLVDLYKLFFQEAFGPGHMIRDDSLALKYLQKELENSSVFDSLLWQPAGYQERFYRINLILVKNETIPLKAFLEAFVNSANSVQTPSSAEWREKWRLILSEIEVMNLKIPRLEEDKTLLERQLEEGNFTVHHSQIYRELYYPHYRIVNKYYFEKLKNEFLISGDQP